MAEDIKLTKKVETAEREKPKPRFDFERTQCYHDGRHVPVTFAQYGPRLQFIWTYAHKR